MRIFNLHGDDWERNEEREGWRSKEVWVGGWGEIKSQAPAENREVKGV